ncbi:tail protein [Mangrovibacter sp. MFB070]|uniref:phage tail sheath subtilisin-like domain-containing protein n=1 Tax=Mangrovibacter sp. MFB070 TaxID=1224318 RepID=UPI0004D70EF4|nr:phage tail sheath subtilisin-like domain-containing protein [Mangrovibacter sp. MFB070]KEA54675.1 tail protein [Mangrovibacter sp. MFB070]
MTVPFARVPNNLRTPLFYVEFDNSMANTATATQRTLLIGGMLSAGTATAGIPERVSSPNTVGELAGKGSLLHAMMTAYQANDSASEIWILPLEEDSGSMVAATGTIKVSSAPTDTGVISLYIAGIRIQLTVVATDTVAGIATSLAAAINAKTSLPVTASAATDTITLTAKNLGSQGNNIDIRLNFEGTPGGEATPEGLVLTITPMAGGAGAPDITGALANLQDRTFDFIVSAYDDTTSIDALKAFLSDSGGRWSWDQQLYGHAFTTTTGTYAALGTKGESRNNQHETMMGVNKSPSPPWVWSAGYAGAAAVSLRNDPGRPLQSLAISGVLAPALEDRFNLTERNNLLYSGISTFTVDDDGTVRIENLITTYQKNSYGDADDSYLQVETLFTLAFVVRFLRTQVTSRFGRMKLAANGTRFAPGAAIVTPNIIRADQIAQYQTLEYQGYVQDSAGFAAGLIVEQNASNPNRVDVLWTGTLINQLRIFALLNQFRLQASTGA